MSCRDYRSVYDTVIFEDEDYELVDSCPIVVFDPETHGITPYRLDPSSYRDAKPFDFVCAYRILQGTLLLERLAIKSANGRYPMVNGVKAVDVRKATKNGWNKYYEYPYYSPEYQAISEEGRLYPYTQFKLAFSGKIRIARGFSKTLAPNCASGIHDEMAYEEVLELKVDHGVVTATRDLSNILARMRILQKRIDDLEETGFLLGADIKALRNNDGFPRSTSENTAFIHAINESDPDMLAAKIEAAEREFHTPRHLVAILPEHRNQEFALDWIASGLVTKHLIDRLRQIVQDGFKEEEVGAWFLRTLLQSPAGKGVSGMASWAVDWHSSKVHLTEHARSAVEAVLAGVTPDRWPE